MGDRSIKIWAAVIVIVGWAVTGAYSVHSYLNGVPAATRSLDRVRGIQWDWVIVGGVRVQCAVVNDEFLRDWPLRKEDGTWVEAKDEVTQVFVRRLFAAYRAGVGETVHYFLWDLKVTGIVEAPDRWKEVDVWIVDAIATE